MQCYDDGKFSRTTVSKMVFCQVATELNILKADSFLLKLSFTNIKIKIELTNHGKERKDKIRSSLIKTTIKLNNKKNYC